VLKEEAGMGWKPFHVEGADRAGRWLVTCDHAANTVPEEVIPGGTLGLADEDMGRHIAYDVGALGVARPLAELLASPMIHTDFSRLVIDPNRGVDDPTLLMKIYDGTIIPANRHADRAETERRLRLCHGPYHQAYEELAARPGIAVCAVHSFTPQFKGRSWRPWQVGVLWARDDRIARPLIGMLREFDLTVGDNEPYAGHLSGDSIDRHALRHGRPNVLIEVRNDLIRDPSGQREWAERLAPVLEAAFEAAEI
jgi:predicted N-formylglutamate amidohydrolase